MMIQRVYVKSLTRLIGYRAHTRARLRQEVSCGKETRKVQKSSHILKPEHGKGTFDFVAINIHTSRNKWFYWQVSNCMEGVPSGGKPGGERPRRLLRADRCGQGGYGKS